MIKVLKMSGRRVTADEEAFIVLVYSGNFKPSESLSYYLKGFGNC